MPTNSEERDIKIIECPRDAMQGIHDFIPTKLKIDYLNMLMKVGFHTIDCGSFVSARAIPQMRDSAEVIEQIDMSLSNSKLSVIVANYRGALDAVKHSNISYLGYPFSISEEFQQRNTNKSIKESVQLVEDIYELCEKHNKEMVIYISMGFGNPYGEEWNSEIVDHWVGVLHENGLNSFSISDTVGVSSRDKIAQVYKSLIKNYKEAEFGAHFHTRIDNWREKVDAAYQNGCVRFDGAIKGYGGCPMANDDLVGNMPTEKLIEYFGLERLELKKAPFEEAFKYSTNVFK